MPIFHQNITKLTPARISIAGGLLLDFKTLDIQTTNVPTIECTFSHNLGIEVGDRGDLGVEIDAASNLGVGVGAGDDLVGPSCYESL
jgi:hypothetical protein